MKPLFQKLLVLILIVAVCAAGYQLMRREGFGQERLPDLNRYSGMVVATREGCGYCDAMGETIGKMKSKFPEKFVQVDCSQRDNPEISAFMKERGVDGFPKIMLFQNGKHTEFTEGGTEDDLTRGINTL